MSQKNGHALESVTLTAMLRRWTSSLLLIAVAAAGALSVMILQNLTIRQENALFTSGLFARISAIKWMVLLLVF